MCKISNHKISLRTLWVHWGMSHSNQTVIGSKRTLRRASSLVSGFVDLLFYLCTNTSLHAFQTKYIGKLKMGIGLFLNRGGGHPKQWKEQIACSEFCIQHGVDPTFIHTSCFDIFCFQIPWSRYHRFNSSELLLPPARALVRPVSFSSEVCGGGGGFSVLLQVLR